MIRLVELALFLTPFAAFFVWRFLAMGSSPSLSLVVGTACVVAVLAVALFWLSEDRALPPGTTYAPARFEDGRVVAGHGVPQ
jgi:hypothetical protein